MTITSQKLSVRAASWVGAQCVRTFCAKNRIVHNGIETFTRYIEAAASAQDIPRWDSYGSALEVTGLGDPLPVRLAGNLELSELIDSVREISASQLYSEWQPSDVTKYLHQSIEIAGLEDPVAHWPGIASHDPEQNGWGKPFFVCEWLLELDKHGYNVILDELVFHLEHGASVERIQKMVGEDNAGVVFHILGHHEISLEVSSESLDSHWNECKKITSGYPQLSSVIYQN